MSDGAVRALHEFVQRHRRLFVLTGAGLSTASGIPCYRDASGAWQHSPPVLARDFLNDEAVRRRYWARSTIGWPMIAAAQPNAGHAALAALERQGRTTRLVTQNVDGLHQRAGSVGVIELHGSVHAVACLACGARHHRASVQECLERDNPHLRGAQRAAAPDGDARFTPAADARFSVPTCVHCGGMLKPAVVFFGEGVPSARVEAARAALEAGDAMLVVGSSLMVYSGFRFCEWAAALRKPIAAVNRGRTRADHLFELKVEADCPDALARLLDAHAGAVPEMWCPTAR